MFFPPYVKAAPKGGIVLCIYHFKERFIWVIDPVSQNGHF